MSRVHPTYKGSLSEGFIYELAQSLDRVIDFKRDKNPIRCPFHGDRHASAFVTRWNQFHCSVCTPGCSIGAREFSARAGLTWNGAYAWRPPMRPFRRHKPRVPTFGSVDAQRVWSVAQRRACDEVHAEDADCRAFLRSRRLDRAPMLGLAGFLGSDSDLTFGKRTWFELGVRLIAPLVNHRGEIVALQGRNVLGREPRLLSPTGSAIKASAYANASALAHLRREKSVKRIVLAEGLTDFLALSAVPGLNVLSTPGTSFAESVMGRWVRGVELVIALDNDRSGMSVRDLVAAAATTYGAKSLCRIEWPAGCKDACQYLDQAGPEELELFLADLIERNPS